MEVQDDSAPDTANRAALLIVAGSSTIAFMLGFNFGAFGEVFFEQVFAVWVLATVVLVASIVAPLPPHTWPRRAILLLPSAWIVLAWIDTTQELQRSDQLLLIVTVAVTVIALPLVGWFLITAINADFAQLPQRHRRIVVAGTAFFLVAGLLFGVFHNNVLSCNDFKISGNFEPENCTQK
ncbi:MAG: hypothetical protein ACR2N2_03795 [Acidimicrobiia bacterium]